MSRPLSRAALLLLTALFLVFPLLAGDVSFHVNMNHQMTLGNFTPNVDQVVVRGSFNGWTGVDPLLRDDGNGVFSATTFVPEGDHEYKFVIVHPDAGEQWEFNIDNRVMTVTADPLDLPVVWFDGMAPTDFGDIEVHFQVDMAVQIASGNFNPGTDQVVIRGGRPELGNWGGAVVMNAPASGTVYDLWVQFPTLLLNQMVEYKFVILPNGNQDAAIWESAPNRSFTPEGSEPDSDSDGFGEIEQPVVYFSDIDPGSVTDHEITVHFQVDMRPAFYKLDDPSADIIDPNTSQPVTSIETVEIAGFFNGWPWGGFAPEFQLHDDGVAPDSVAGDSIYTVDVVFPAGASLGQEYKYGINGLDVESGFGENHLLTLDNGLDEMVTHDMFGEPGNWYDPWIGWLTPPMDYEILFQVDMSSVPDTVFNSANQEVGVRGSVPELGGWMETVVLSPTVENPAVYEGMVIVHGLRPGNWVEYKYVFQPIGDNVNVAWEADPNRGLEIMGDEVDTDANGMPNIVLEPSPFRYVVPVNITSIHDIQYVDDVSVSDASPLVGQVVTIQGWATFDPAAGNGSKFFVADAPGPWNGIYVYAPNGTPRVGFGWEVRITGEVTEYFGMTELIASSPEDIQVINPSIHWGQNPPEAVMYSVVPLSNLQDNIGAEPWESVLIQVEDVHTTALPGDFGEWTVGNDQAESLVIDNPMNGYIGYNFNVQVGQPFERVRGILNYTYNAYKLLPEIAYDLRVTSAPELGWYTPIPYIQQVRYSDIYVHRNEGVEEYRNDYSYASSERYDVVGMGEEVTVLGLVMLEPGISHAGASAAKFLIADTTGFDMEFGEYFGWSSIVVYVPDASNLTGMAVGDMVQVTGTVSEYIAGQSHLTELMVSPDPNAVQVVGHLNEMPPIKQIGLGQVWDYYYAEMHEGGLVHTGGGVVWANDNEDVKKLFLVEDGNDEMPAVLVGGDCAPFRDPGYTPPITGTEIAGITGWIENAWGMLSPMTEWDNIFRINPRNPDDIEIVGGGGEQHFFPVPETGLPYAVVVASATLDDMNLMPGDEIAVFDGDLCVGASIVTDFPVSITAWQEDTSLELVGFTPGHEIIFRVWSSGDMQEYPAQASYIEGNGTFGAGFGSNVNLTAMRQVSFTMPLAANRFELISMPLLPMSLDVTDVFGGLADLQIVYADNGGFYWPTAGVNTIGSMDVTEGYRVFVSNAQNLELVGSPLDPNAAFTLHANQWNWMGYPRMNPQDAVGALSPIAGQLIIIMNDDGHVYWPSSGVNTLGELVPGEGYQVFVSEDVTFSFGDNPPPAKRSGNMVTEIAELPDAPAPTGLPYPVMVTWDESPEMANVAAIELYDGELMVGKGAKIEGRNRALVVAWGGSSDLGLSGFTSGHAIQVRAVTDAGAEIPLKAPSQGQEYGKGPAAQMGIEPVELPTEFTVGNGYPNPFNPSITIPFGLPAGGEVTVSVYNLLGQRVLHQQLQLPAGYHRYVFRAQPELVSGVYFIRIQQGAQARMQKVMLLK